MENDIEYRNWTSRGNDSSILHQRSMRMLNIWSLAIVIIATLVFNILAILFIVLKKSKTTLKDKLISLLCLANLFQTIGYTIGLYAATRGNIGHIACLFGSFLLCSLTYSSVGYFVALAVERYISIRYPFNYVVWVKPRNSLWLIIPPTVGFLAGACPLLGWGGYGRSRERDIYCAFDFTNKTVSAKSYLIFIVTFVLLLPIIVTSVCFLGIFMELRKTAAGNRRKFGKSSIISRHSEKNVHQQYVSSILTGLVYFSSWVPYAVVCFMQYYTVPVPLSLEYVAIYLSKTATITSPVIFCLIEKQFLVFIRARYRSHDGGGVMVEL